MKGFKKIILALAAVAITMVYLGVTHRVPPPRSVTWDHVKAEAAAGGYRIISTDSILQRYHSTSETMLLVDTRQEWEYRTGHIKGAVNFPIEPTWLSRWRKKGALEKLLGPDKNRFIVFY